MQLSRELQHITTIPPGPDGRPGARLRTPSLNQHATQIDTDGARTDLRVLLGPHGSTLLGVSFGVGDETGPLAAAEDAIQQSTDRRHGRCVKAPAETTMAGCAAITYEIKLHSGLYLHEWNFMREGWLFGVSILRHPRDFGSVESLGRRSLETWEWTAGTESTVVPAASPESVVEIREITDSIVTTAPIETVWALLRRVENNRLLHTNFLEAYHVPGTPTGVGEEQAVVFTLPGYRRTVTSIIVEDTPPTRLVMRGHGVNNRHDQQIYTLEAAHGQTKLTISLRYPIGVDLAEREAKAQNAREVLHEYLGRVADVLTQGWEPPAATGATSG